MKKAAFRVDASTTIGSGHLMRCLALADALKVHGAEIHFICRHVPAVYETRVTQRGFTLHPLPAVDAPPLVDDNQSPPHAHWLGASWKADAQASLDILESLDGVDLLVIDHYAIDTRWERCVRAKAKKILVIDDLADRAHDCDFLLDQNFYADQSTRYKRHLDEKTQCLLGPHYALLRPEFAEARKTFPRAARPLDPVKRMNIGFGGVDAAGGSLKALEALKPWLEAKSLAVDVILGEASLHREAVEFWSKRYPTVTLHISPNNIAELLAVADLGLGAAGSMTWERACVGVPSIALSVAPNQQPIGVNAGRAGMHLFVGESREASVEQIRSAIAILISNPPLRQSFADRSLRLVDGEGAQRCVRHVFRPTISLRRAAIEDCEHVFAWRNAPANRRHAHDAREISFEEHRRWFERVLRTEDHVLLIGSDINGPVGVLSYDRKDEHWLTSIYLVPARHGEGLGAPLLLEGIDWLKSRYEGPITIHAEIQSENVASETVFQQAGYQKRFSTFATEVNVYERPLHKNR